MNVKSFVENLLLDARGKDIKFKSTDELGKYKEKVTYWKECTYVMVGLAVIGGIVWLPLAIPPALVAARKVHLIYTKKPPVKKEDTNETITPMVETTKTEGTPAT